MTLIEPTEYGLQHPIIRPPSPSPWLVVGSVDCPWHAPHVMGQSLDIHLDADDPNHTFLGPEAFHGWPNARKLSEWYNAQYRRSMRLRIRRSMEFTGEDHQRWNREIIAFDALKLTQLINKNPTEEHSIFPHLDWSPTTQVWLNGRKWVKYVPQIASN